MLHVDRQRDELRRIAAKLRDKPVRTIDEAVRDYYQLRSDYTARLDNTLGQTLQRLEQAAP